jgi:hypothetical protein
MAPASGAIGVAHALQSGVELDVVQAGEERVDRLALGNEPDLAVDRWVPVGAAAQNKDLTRGRGEEPGEHVQQGRLAGAVRAEQAGNPGAEREAHVVDGDDVAVPASDPPQLDGGRSRRGLRGRHGGRRRSRGRRHAGNLR